MYENSSACLKRGGDETVKIGAINGEANELGRVIDALQDRLMLLRDRLMPVSQLLHPTCSAEQPPDKELPPLADGLRMFRRKVTAAREDVDDMIARLEI